MVKMKEANELVQKLLAADIGELHGTAQHLQRTIAFSCSRSPGTQGSLSQTPRAPGAPFSVCSPTPSPSHLLSTGNRCVLNPLMPPELESSPLPVHLPGHPHPPQSPATDSSTPRLPVLITPATRDLSPEPLYGQHCYLDTGCFIWVSQQTWDPDC